MFSTSAAWFRDRYSRPGADLSTGVPARGHGPDCLFQDRGGTSACRSRSTPESRHMSEADTSKPSRIALLGVPIEIGASQAGTLMGPAALRTAGIARLLEQLEFAVDDHGDMARPVVASDGPVPQNAKFYDEVKAWIRL